MYKYTLYVGGSPSKRKAEEELDNKQLVLKRGKFESHGTKLGTGNEFTNLTFPNVPKVRFELINLSMTPTEKKMVSFSIKENIEQLDFFTAEIICGNQQRYLQSTIEATQNQLTTNSQIQRNNTREMLIFGATSTITNTLIDPVFRILTGNTGSRTVYDILRNFPYGPAVVSTVSPFALNELAGLTSGDQTVRQNNVKLDECDKLYKMLCEQKSDTKTDSLSKSNSYRQIYLDKYPYLRRCIDVMDNVNQMVNKEGNLVGLGETHVIDIIDSFKKVPNLTFGMAQFYMSLCIKCHQSYLPCKKLQVYLIDFFKIVVESLSPQQRFEAAYGFELCRFTRMVLNLSTLEYLDDFVEVFSTSVKIKAFITFKANVSTYLKNFDKEITEYKPAIPSLSQLIVLEEGLQQSIPSLTQIIVLDEGELQPWFKIRFIDGTQMKVRASLTRTVGELKRKMASERPDVASSKFTLWKRNPLRKLEDNETVYTAELANSVVNQKLET